MAHHGIDKISRRGGHAHDIERERWQAYTRCREMTITCSMHCHTAFYDPDSGDLVVYDQQGDELLICEYEDLEAHVTRAYGYQFVAQDGPQVHCGNCGQLIQVRMHVATARRRGPTICLYDPSR